MYSTDVGKTDPVRLFNLWLSKVSWGMKDTGPISERHKSSSVNRCLVHQNANGTKHHRQYHEIHGLLGQAKQEVDRPRHEENIGVKTEEFWSTARCHL